MQPLASFQMGSEVLHLFGCKYKVGPAVGFVLTDDHGMPYGTVTVNVPGYPLGDDEVLVKTWEENAALRQPLLQTGFFEDTGKRAPCGFVEAEVWRIRRPQVQVH